MDNTAITYLHTDHLATPRKATNEAGQVVWQWESEAFGNALPQSSGIAVNLRFPGQYYDAETGLYYNYFRYYDPGTGRYVTSDPIGLDGGVNTYTYTSNNPVNYYDPDGLFWWMVAGCGIGAILDWDSIYICDDCGNCEVDLVQLGVACALGGIGGGATGTIGKKAATEILKKQSKQASAKKAAKAQFRKEAAGLETKVIRSGRDGNGKIVGVGTKGRGGPTYRPKSDGSYSVGKRGDVKHYRPTPGGGHTVNQR